MTTVNCQIVHGFLIKVVKPYSSKFLAMMADDRSNNKYASIWCKNETKSLIREDPVVNLRGRKQKSWLINFILFYSNLYEFFLNFFIEIQTFLKFSVMYFSILSKEAIEFCEANGMKLWYPTKPFDNVPQKGLQSKSSTSSTTLRMNIRTILGYFYIRLSFSLIYPRKRMK